MCVQSRDRRHAVVERTSPTHKPPVPTPPFLARRAGRSRGALVRPWGSDRLPLHGEGGLGRCAHGREAAPGTARGVSAVACGQCSAGCASLAPGSKPYLPRRPSCHGCPESDSVGEGGCGQRFLAGSLTYSPARVCAPHTPANGRCSSETTVIRIPQPRPQRITRPGADRAPVGRRSHGTCRRG